VDQSGVVVWDEWRNTEAVLAAIYSKLTLDEFDDNSDGVMNNQELAAFVRENFDDGLPEDEKELRRELMHDIWKMSQLDGDDQNGDIFEISQFWMNFWNLLIEDLE